MNSEIIRASKIQINKAVISDFLRGTSIEMFSFVLGLFVLRETNSALGFALTEFLGPVLGIIFTPAIGSLIDSHKHKPLILLSQIVSIILLLIFLFVFLFLPKARFIAIIFNQRHPIGY